MSTAPNVAVPQLTLGWRLRLSMGQAGKNTSDMAHILEMDRSTISQWLNDRAVPKKTWYLRIWADETGVPLEWLIYGVDPTPPKPPRGRGLRGRDSNSQPTGLRAGADWLTNAA